MTEGGLAVTVYFEDGSDPGLMDLARQLDELGVGYDEVNADSLPHDVRAQLEAKAARELSFPAVLVNDELLVQPSVPALMSALMNAGSSGFYQ